MSLPLLAYYREEDERAAPASARGSLGPLGKVTTWLASPGQTVLEGQPLGTVRREAKEYSVLAPCSGTLLSIEASVGTPVSVGAVVCTLEPFTASQCVSAMVRFASAHQDTAIRLLALEHLARESLRGDHALYLVFKLCSIDRAPLVRERALAYLATHWRAHPETLPWLKHLVETSSPSFATSALDRLVKDWAHDADNLLPWLLTIARCHDSAQLRETALHRAARLRRLPSDEEFADIRDRFLHRATHPLPQLRQPLWPPRPERLDRARAEHQAWLQQQTVSHPDPSVRFNALACLVYLLARSPALHPILRACSLDHCPEVRGAALGSLDSSFGTHPETVPWLEALIDHEDEGVAMDALPLLVDAWGAKPRLWPGILTQLQLNTRATVRKACLGLLLRMTWRDAPEALELVQRCQREDPDEGVRQVAGLLLQAPPTNGDTHFKLPNIGENVSGARVLAWLVQPGDLVLADQDLIEVGTDKGIVLIGAPCAGRVMSLRWAVGEEALVGSVLCVIAPERRLRSSPIARHQARTAVGTALGERAATVQPPPEFDAEPDAGVFADVPADASAPVAAELEPSAGRPPEVPPTAKAEPGVTPLTLPAVPRAAPAGAPPCAGWVVVPPAVASASVSGVPEPGVGSVPVASAATAGPASGSPAPLPPVEVTAPASGPGASGAGPTPL